MLSRENSSYRGTSHEAKLNFSDIIWTPFDKRSLNWSTNYWKTSSNRRTWHKTVFMITHRFEGTLVLKCSLEVSFYTLINCIPDYFSLHYTELSGRWNLGPSYSQHLWHFLGHVEHFFVYLFFLENQNSSQIHTRVVSISKVYLT